MVGEMAYRQRFEPVPIKKTGHLGQHALACQRLTAQPTAPARRVSRAPHA
jgi:hypothetical protein